MFGEIAGGAYGVDHVMAHFWKLGRTEPGDGLDLVRHGSASNYTYADGHASSADFAETFDIEKRSTGGTRRLRGDVDLDLQP